MSISYMIGDALHLLCVLLLSTGCDGHGNPLVRDPGPIICAVKNLLCHTAKASSPTALTRYTCTS
jgi:hypothetical protein